MGPNRYTFTPRIRTTMPGQNITIQDIMMMHILAFANNEKTEKAAADDLEQVAGWALSRENAPQANWAINKMREYAFSDETIKRIEQAFQTNLDNLDELIARRRAWYMNTPESVPSGCWISTHCRKIPHRLLLLLLLLLPMTLLPMTLLPWRPLQDHLEAAKSLQPQQCLQVAQAS